MEIGKNLGWRGFLLSYPVPTATVLGDYFFLVADPVAVPSPQRSGVVHTDSVDSLDLKTGTLQAVDDEVERRGSVGTGEDVLVHEQAPDEVLVLPRLTQTGHLNVEDTIVVEHVVALAEEGAQVADTDVLGHFQTGDFFVATFGHRDVAVVHAVDLRLLFGNAGCAEPVVAPGGLVAAKSDTRSFGTVVGGSEFGKSAPPATNIEHSLALLKTDLLADNGKLVVLELFEAFLLVDVGDDTGGVDHARTEEPSVEVVASVVVVADLFFVLAASVHDNFGHHACQEEPVQAQGKPELGPVMSVLHNFQSVTVELYVAVKVHFVESLHWNLVAASVLDFVAVFFKRKVVLDGSAGETSFFVDARGHGGSYGPECHEDRDSGEDGEEDPCEEAAVDFPC